MKWIAWGWRVVDREKIPYRVGDFESGMNATTAMRDARLLWGQSAIDYVQSALSYAIERRETGLKLQKKNGNWINNRHSKSR